jgi:hypothetical protein
VGLLLENVFMPHPKKARLSRILELVLGAASQAASAVKRVHQSQILSKAKLQQSSFDDF